MTRPVQANDLYGIRFVADPQISPDGRFLAYVITRADEQQNRNVSVVRVQGVTDSDRRYEISHEASEVRAPRWSPDGSSLAFISDRSGTAQLFLHSTVDGGEQQLTDADVAVLEYCWTPGGQLVFVRSTRSPESTEHNSDTIVIRSLAYKFNGEGFVEGRRKHLFLLDSGSGDLRQLTRGEFDATQPVVSSVGKSVAFTRARIAERETHLESDIALVDLDSGSVTDLTSGDGAYSGAAWSPDGTHLSFVGNPVPATGTFPIQAGLFVHDLETGEQRRVMTDLDRIPGAAISSDSVYHSPISTPQWSRDGIRIYTLTGDQGLNKLVSVAGDGRGSDVLFGAGEILSFSMAPDGSFYLPVSSIDVPPEIFRLVAGAEPEPVTNENEAFTGAVSMLTHEEFWIESDSGVNVHSFVILPPDFDRSKQYPAIVSVHGGPHGMYSTGFYYWLQVMAGRGYVVLMPNPRASTGYGQDWLSGIQDDWGGADYRDVMAALDGLLERYPIDQSRIGITGESYGGYMTNWAITQTDRYAAAVTQNSSCNRYSLYGTADMVMMYSDREFGGSPYERPENYLSRSAISFVRNVSTPTLILHSEKDMRVPISQGEEWFVALKKQGVEVEFVRFPGEHHMITRLGTPQHRIERIERTMDWFDRHMPAAD